MAPTVVRFEDADAALAAARVFRDVDPVRHNLIHTLLLQRIAHPEPGRYWVACDHGGAVGGVVFQSPLDFFASVTPMDDATVDAMVEAIASTGPIPGVIGDVRTAARFAGAWTERTRTSARPEQGMRLYEVGTVIEPTAVPGGPRSPEDADVPWVIDAIRSFGDEIGEPILDAEVGVPRRIDAGLLAVWDDAGPGAVAGTSLPVGGVVRIGPVYTPPAARGRGYASALVGHLAHRIRESGDRCILYTDLDNATSNAIYRALGFAAVEECLRYRFDLPE